MSEEMLTTLDEINTNANRLVAAVTPDQWESATPCSEWNVRELVNHMTGTTNLFGASASRSQPAAMPDADHVGDDPVGAFAEASAKAAAAWRNEGALEGMVSIPAEMPAVACLGVNIIDIGTHCWDLASAIGADHGLSEGAVAMIDQWNRQVISDEIRAGGGFGAELSSSGGQLADMLAFVGRTA